MVGYQAIQSREHTLDLFALVVGASVSGIGALIQFGGGAFYSQPVIIGLLLASGLMTTLLFVRYIGLSRIYRESRLTMNTIKEVYLEKAKMEMPEMAEVFRWRLKTVPAGEPWESVTAVSVYPLLTIGSAYFAGAAFTATSLALRTTRFLIPDILMSVVPVSCAILVLAISVWFHIRLFRTRLRLLG